MGCLSVGDSRHYVGAAPLLQSTPFSRHVSVLSVAHTHETTATKFRNNNNNNNNNNLICIAPVCAKKTSVALADRNNYCD